MLRLIPLGGLGEIGMNTLLFESGEEVLCIDCGVMFPDDQTLGIELIVPDLCAICECRERLLAYLLTHGHEYHIVALPFALQRAPAPVYGSRFTLALVRAKLEEYGIPVTSGPDGERGPDDPPEA